MTIPPVSAAAGVWDARLARWTCPLRERRVDWAYAHLPDVDRAWRAEFFLIDTPFAVLYRYAENADGRRWIDPDTREAAQDDPLVVPLAELPPPELLKVEG